MRYERCNRSSKLDGVGFSELDDPRLDCDPSELYEVVSAVARGGVGRHVDVHVVVGPAVRVVGELAREPRGAAVARHGRPTAAAPLATPAAAAAPAEAGSQRCARGSQF